MNATPERSMFKRSFGQSNHFLVTIIVGLDAVKHGGADVHSDLPIAWDPKDPARSAARSEEFAIQAGIVFLVTALGGYLGEAARRARPAAPDLRAALDSAAANKKGLHGKVLAFAEFSKSSKSAELALVESAIHWRNRLIHPRSNARLTSELRDQLLKHAPEYFSDYRHLDPAVLIERFNARESSPTLKEAAGMIVATHRFIRAVDAAVLETVDYERHMEEALRSHLKGLGRQEALDRANRIWGRTEPRARLALINLARQNGLADATADASNGLTEATIERLARMSSKDAMLLFASK